MYFISEKLLYIYVLKNQKFKEQTTARQFIEIGHTKAKTYTIKTRVE
jgi:hypothetical protein